MRVILEIERYGPGGCAAGVKAAVQAPTPGPARVAAVQSQSSHLQCRHWACIRCGCAGTSQQQHAPDQEATVTAVCHGRDACSADFAVNGSRPRRVVLIERLYYKDPCP